MKICTACNATYSDETLNYCLIDGTTLTPEKYISFEQVPFSYKVGSWSETETPTQVSNQTDFSSNSETPPTAASSFSPTLPFVPQKFPSPPSGKPSRSFMNLPITAGAVVFGIAIGLLMATNRNNPAEPEIRVVASKNSAANAAVTNTAVITNSAPTNEAFIFETNGTLSKKIDLTGTWKGKFNESSAVLLITAHKGETFSGTLSKNGYVVEFVGRINYAKSSVSIKETKVLEMPPGSRWNLGEDNGTISENGKAMRGTGKDKNISYGWSFTKQ